MVNTVLLNAVTDFLYKLPQFSINGLNKNIFDNFGQSLNSEPMFQGEFFEASNIIICLILLIFTLKTRGKWLTIKIFVVGMFYGLVLENGGPMQAPALGFNGYFWEENYKIYLFEFFGHGIRLSKVPLATHLGWSMVFLVSLTFYEVIADAFPKLKNRYVVGGLIITSSGLLMDLSLDPIATRFHWWVWNDDLLPVWFGVPLINYVAWFWAVLVFGAFWIWIHNKFPGDSDEDNKNQIKWLVYMLFPMWLIDTMGVMATRMFMEIGQVMYKTPYTFHWEVWHPVAILGIVLGIIFSIRYFYLEFKMKNKKNSTRT